MIIECRPDHKIGLAKVVTATFISYQISIPASLSSSDS